MKSEPEKLLFIMFYAVQKLVCRYVHVANEKCFCVQDAEYKIFT